VEERLEFFEKGTPPTKNADAIRKVLEELGLEEDDDEEGMDVDQPAFTSLEAEPKKEKKKKRKSEDMDVDEEDDDDHSAKKVKLSKEEKKALKKAKKEKAKAEAVPGGGVSDRSLSLSCRSYKTFLGRTIEEGKEGEEGEKRKEEEQGLTTFSYFLFVCMSFDLWLYLSLSSPRRSRRK